MWGVAALLSKDLTKRRVGALRGRDHLVTRTRRRTTNNSTAPATFTATDS
jgi:hypothetical protein